MDRWYLLVRQAGVIAWRRRWLLIAAAWAVCVLGWIGVYLTPNSYESEARLYVDTDAVLTPLLKGLAIETRTQSQLEMMQRTLLRRPNLDKLISITSLNLYATDPEERQALLRRLSTTIAITSDGPNLFTIHYRNDNPQLAFQIVSGLVNIFMEEATGSSMSDMQNAQRFLNEQIASFEKQLRAAEQRRATFISKYFDILPLIGNGGAPLQEARARVQQLELQLKNAQTGQVALQEVLRSTPQTLKGQLPESVAATVPGTAAQTKGQLEAQLTAAEQKLAELRSQDTDQNPDVISQLQIIDGIKSAIQQVPTSTQSSGKDDAAHDPAAMTMANPAYEQEKMKQLVDGVLMSSLQVELAAAQKKLANLEQLARNAPEVQAQFENLDRGYSVLRHQYEELLSRRESSTITAAADTGADRVRLRVIDPPQMPIDPVAPNRPLLDSGVLVAGLGAAVGLAFLLSQSDQSVIDISQLRDFGLPVLGGLSVFHPARRRNSYLQVLTLASALLILIALYGGLILHAMPHSKEML